MSNFKIVAPLPIGAIAADRGTGATNLLTPSPKEVWADAASGSEGIIRIDLGQAQLIDTIFLGHVRPPAAGATWTVVVAGSAVSVLVDQQALRVPDVAGAFATTSHALWHGAPLSVSVIELRLNQPAGSPPLTAGTLVIGRSVSPELGQEWGFGRQPIDTGSATPLPDGGFSVVEGVRKRAVSWTFGDLSQAETDQLEQIGLTAGSTSPVLVIENVARTAGLLSRIVYGRFDRWRAFERRNRRQTRWEFSVEEWV